MESLLIAFYIISIALQMSSSLLVANIILKRGDIIKSFVNSNLVIKDNDKNMLIYNHEAFTKEVESIFLAKVSLLYMFSGIFLEILGENEFVSKSFILLLVPIITILFVSLGKYMSYKVVSKTRVISPDEITEEDQLPSPLTNNEIDKIIEKTS